MNSKCGKAFWPRPSWILSLPSSDFFRLPVHFSRTAQNAQAVPGSQASS